MYIWRQYSPGPHPLGPKEIFELLVPPGKAYTLLTDHLITGKPLWFEPAEEKCFKAYLDGYIALFGCLDLPIFCKSPIKWRQCPDMTIAVAWEMHEFKQTNKQNFSNCKNLYASDYK